MKILNLLSIIPVLLVVTMPAFAAPECMTQEINPRTKVPFSSLDEYQATIRQWAEKAPQSPGIFVLAKAFGIYSKEKKAAIAFGNDKLAHCFIGCRISQETSYRATEYVGWLKESRDIKDCDKETHFEPADFEATVHGAQLGQSQRDSAGCFAACKANY